MKTLLRRILLGAMIILLVLIIAACASPLSTDVYNELPVKDEAVTTSPKAASLSTSLPVTCQVSGLAISPIKVNPGEKATVTAYVMNTGNDEVSYIAELEINKVIAQVVEVEIPAGGIKSVTFRVAKGEPGNYEISCGGISSQLVVINTVIPPKSNTSLLSPPQSSAPSCCPPPVSDQSNIPSVSNNPEASTFSRKPSTPSCCP